MKHPKKVENYQGSMEQLADDIGDLEYGALINFLGFLAGKLDSDSRKDAKRGRPQLAKNLENAHWKLLDAQTFITNAWEISEPRMRDSDESNR